MVAHGVCRVGALQVIPVAGTFAGLALSLFWLVMSLVAPLLFRLF